MCNCKQLLSSVGCTVNTAIRVKVQYATTKKKSNKGVISKNMDSVKWGKKKGTSEIDLLEMEVDTKNEYMSHLFIYLMADKKRIGFIRLNTKQLQEICDSSPSKSKPEWRNVISIENGRVVGQLLISLSIHQQQAKG